MQNISRKIVEKGRKYVNILGIRVNGTPIDRLLASLEDNITHNVRFYIVTPNPELVLMAQKDGQLKLALNSTAFSIPDGMGLAQAAKYLSLKSPKMKVLRYPAAFFQGIAVGLATFFNKKWLTQELKPVKGRELFMKLIALADKNSWKVYFLGGESGEAALAAKKLGETYKKVRIEAESGPMFNNQGEPATKADRKLYKDTVKRINGFNPDFLIVCFQDPKEEKFVYKNYKKLNIGGAGAFGGTFRYVAGLSRLPPGWLSNLGLEWLWRLITEPYRLKRVLNAFPIFPLKIFWYKVNE